MRHVPAPTSATVLDGVPAEDLVSETVAPGAYTSMALARGTRIRLTDVTGDACAHLLLHRADATVDLRLHVDTIRGGAG